MSRKDDRGEFEPDVRLALLEGDADKCDEEKSSIHAELRNISRIMMGLLVSVATAAIFLAANVALQAMGE